MINRERALWFTVAAALVCGCGVKQHLHDPGARPGNPTPSESGGASGANAPAVGQGGQAGAAPMPGGGAGGAQGGQGPATGQGGASATPNPDAPGSSERPDTRPAPADGSSSPPPPPSGTGITIGGSLVAKEKAIVFLHVGHSDMAGRADAPAALRPFFTDMDPHLWIYAKGGAFRRAAEPTAGDSASVGKGGPGMAILRTALGHAPDAFFISIGHGHSGAAGGYCPNFRKGGPLYPLFMDAARELKGKVTFGGIFTMFGITEYRLGTPGLTGLRACLTGLADEVRAELGDPQIPLLVGDWNMGGTGIYAPDSEYGRVVRPQIQMVPTSDPRAAVIPTDGLPMQDDRHLNFQGHKTWAERAFAIMMQKGWLPWAQR